MFNKTSDNKEIETIIGPSVKVNGDFDGQGDIIIEGIFEGTLKTSGGLYVGEKAKINGSVEAASAQISGEVTGNMKIKGYLEMAPSAKIFGDVELLEISIARGAILNGKCLMTNKTKSENKSETK